MQLTAEALEQMRTIGLVLDRAGRFWHQGAPVTHQGLHHALLRWLDVREDGRNIVRLDPKRYAYVEVEDAHLRARSARWIEAGPSPGGAGDRCVVLWDDDSEEELDYASLREALDHAFYVRVHDKLIGRIAGPAHHVIASRVVEEGEGFALPAAGRLWPFAHAEESGSGARCGVISGSVPPTA